MATRATFWLLLLYLGSRSTQPADTIEAADHRAGGLLPRQRRLDPFGPVCRPVPSCPEFIEGLTKEDARALPWTPKFSHGLIDRTPELPSPKSPESGTTGRNHIIQSLVEVVENYLMRMELTWDVIESRLPAALQN